MKTNEKIKVAVIATGEQSRLVIKNLLKDSNENVEIASVFDPNYEVVRLALEEWNIDSKDVNICDNYYDAINSDGIQWVMIFSPNVYHKEHILAAFSANKHVFSEKPLATSIEDCQEIFEAHAKTNLLFATGFVLRYAPIYRRAYEIIQSGILGELCSIEANENIAPDHGGYIMKNWRRLTKIAGPHILEKCCHDLDLMNWYCNSLPKQVFAFATKRFFISKNRYLENKYGKDTFEKWYDAEATETAFSDDSDLMDCFIGTACYRNGILVSFNATMSNAIPERRMRFNCNEGTMTLDLYSGVLNYKTINGTLITEHFPENVHEAGDLYIMKELYDTMCTNKLPICSGQEGLDSAVFALAFDKSYVEKKVVDLEPIWSRLNR